MQAREKVKFVLCVKHHNEQNMQSSNTHGGQMPMLWASGRATLVYKHCQTAIILLHFSVY